MSALADRIRGIVTPCAGPRESRIPNPESHDLSSLGGQWVGSCFIVDRRWEPDARHGREMVGDLAGRVRDACGHATLLAGGAPAGAPFVFFDLETTGLSGGAGTHAFLVGCGGFEPDGAFVTRQFMLTRYADERALLDTVAGELSRAGALVSFNGKSFDAPVLETRYLFHRLDWIGARIPHIDVLHPARRFWKRSVGRAFQARLDRGLVRAALHDDGCSLLALEKQILAVRRVADVPGFEIPARYFQFVRTGDARPLAAVLEHNQLDLLTLAALTARLLHLARTGPSAARDAREAFALGVVYTRGGLDAEARNCYRRAVEMSPAPIAAFDPVRLESLRALAVGWRRARQHDEAACCWRQVLDTRGCPPPIAREATEALAIHHEHRVRDLAAAKAFALRSLDAELPPARTQAVRHRLARIERKMEVGRLL